ncbi:putative 3-dehydroshikimate dehydratase QA-4 [Coleophoma cylindrospora]|uniref:Putative 3-dehydroshikimate dehydratase QA-4 n=1 Tax=Coleophoma cylindrospora TaxID=1849047 RepID=A0A3D8RTC9_9HELO|nr:putative 3-dehydroshikimate dehydratase QA-4 [Coleophoma cylindrospora]
MGYKLAIASMSLGRAWVHQIPQKFAAAAAAGIQGIEIFYEDLVYHASALPGGLNDENLLEAAHQFRSICDSLSLTIMGIGPFNGYEGILDPTVRAKKLVELQLWFQMAKIVGTDIIQVPCTLMTEGVTGEQAHLVRDFREIAELGLKQEPVIRFAYENLCFGTFNDTWEKAYSLVAAVDYPNFGMCLDTFNITGREWADPASPTGCVPNADAVFAASLQKMVKTIDPKKVFYVQIVDAERLAKPLDETHEFHVDGQKPRMSWSRNCRLFLCEEDRGGYLPVLDCLKAICDGIGYEGWISIELFNRTLVETGEHVPLQHAERGVKSWEKLVPIMGWENRLEEQRTSTARPAVAPVERKEVENLARL